MITSRRAPTNYIPFGGIRIQKTQTTITIERYIMAESYGELRELRRIANAMEEILRLVKKDMERMEKIKNED